MALLFRFLMFQQMMFLMFHLMFIFMLMRVKPSFKNRKMICKSLGGCAKHVSDGAIALD